MNKLAPSILSADFSKLGEDVSQIEKGGAHLIHVDVMDGHFVPNISFGSTVMKSLVGKTTLPFDVHLMIKNPMDYIKDFVTEQTEYITVHYEACSNLDEVISCIKETGIKVGVSIKPDTRVEELFPYLDKIDMILIMSVYPGFGGQKMIMETLENIKVLDEIRKTRQMNYVIEVDGGVTLENINLVLEKGCDIVVAGSAVFGQEDITGTTQKFCEKL